MLRLALHFNGDGFVVDKYAVDVVSPCPTLEFFVVTEMKEKIGKLYSRLTEEQIMDKIVWAPKGTERVY